MHRSANDRNAGDRDFAAARRNFEAVWNPSRWRYMRPEMPEPTIAELLGVDRDYRARAGQDWPRDNPPVILLQRNHRQYVARYVNGGRTRRRRDWVVLQVNGTTPGRHYTVLTQRFGRLEGRRVVRGRETECLGHYLKRGPAV